MEECWGRGELKTVGGRGEMRGGRIIEDNERNANGDKPRCTDEGGLLEGGWPGK